jgi:hypothetical protein
MSQSTEPTRLFELLVTFTGRSRQLSYNIQNAGEDHLLHCLADRCKQHVFYEVAGPEGRHCLFNTAHIARLNVLDSLAGLQVEAKSPLSGDEAEEEDEVREIYPEPVIVRLWLRGDEELVVHHEIEHDQWKCIKISLIEGEKFIRLTDADGETVIYGTDYIDAMEMFDPFYLDDDQVEKILTEAEDDIAPEPSSAPAPPNPTESSPLDDSTPL